MKWMVKGTSRDESAYVLTTVTDASEDHIPPDTSWGNLAKLRFFVPPCVSGMSAAHRYTAGFAGNKTGSRQSFHQERKYPGMSRREPNQAIKEKVRAGSARRFMEGAGRARAHLHRLAQCHLGLPASARVLEIQLLHPELRPAWPFNPAGLVTWDVVFYISQPVSHVRGKVEMAAFQQPWRFLMKWSKDGEIPPHGQKVAL